MLCKSLRRLQSVVHTARRSVDASKDGSGTVLLKAETDYWNLFAYPSRTMTKTN